MPSQKQQACQVLERPRIRKTLLSSAGPALPDGKACMSAVAGLQTASMPAVMLSAASHGYKEVTELQGVTCAHCCSGPCQRALHSWDPASCLPGTCGYSTLGPAQQRGSVGIKECRTEFLYESTAQRRCAAILNTLYDQKPLSSVAG